MKTTNTIAQRIKSLRQENKMTQVELSLQLQKSDSTIRMWELDKSQPDIETLLLLANIFDVSVDYLLGKTEIKKTPAVQQRTASESEDYFVSKGLTRDKFNTLSDDKKRLLAALINEIVNSTDN